jgi:toxin ParE1/3/4
MNIIWSPEAIEDLISLRAYIAEESPAVARRIVLRILHDVERLLPDNPHMGRPGRYPERANWSCHKRPTSFPTACNVEPSRFCASITAPGVGRTACSVGKSGLAFQIRRHAN